MKRCLILSCLLCCSAALAQPAWLKDVAATAKGKSFNPKAAYAVLHFSAEAQISDKMKSTTHVRQACKVLLPAGESEVILSQPGSKSLTVNNLQGWSLLPDGKVLELKKTDIFKISAFEDVASYGDSYTLVAAPPKSEVGAIVAYEYDLEESGIAALMQQFNLQAQQPIVDTRITISAPSGWQLKYTGDNLEPFKVDERAGSLTFIAHDLPYQPSEPYMPPWSYLARRIYTIAADPDPAHKTSLRSWQDVADWYRSLLKELPGDDRDLIETTQAVTGGCTTPSEKIMAIGRYVQERIRYVAVELGKGSYQPRTAAETLANMYGDCKDKSHLMCAMLNAAGIEAVPALTNSTHLIQEELPNPFQFNHVIVAVPAGALDGAFASERALVNDWLFIDPTDPTTRVGDLPAALQGRQALPVNAIGAELKKLPYGEATHYTQAYTAQATLHSDGSVTAMVTVKYLGNKAKEQRYNNQFLTTEEQVENWRSLLSSTIPNVQISNFRFIDQGDSSVVQFSLQGGHYLTNNGDHFLLKTDFICSPEHPTLTAPERHHPIWLGPPVRYLSHFIWDVPEGWTVASGAFQLRHDDPLLQINSSASLQDSLLICHYEFERRGYLLAREEYKRAQAIDVNHVIGDGLTMILLPPASAGK